MSRCQATSDGFPRRWATGSTRDPRATTMTLHGPAKQAQNNRVASVTCRDRPKAPSGPQSSECPVSSRKTPTKVLGKPEQPPKQATRPGFTGSRKSPNKRPPFVVGTGSSTTAYRVGVSGGRAYATTKTTESHRNTSSPSKDRRAVNGSVPNDAGTELKLQSRNERQVAHATETMTLISNNDAGDATRQTRDRVGTPDVTEPSATFIVTDPLPDVHVVRASRKQSHPSPDECIRQVAEKLSEFAAMHNNTAHAAKTGNGTIPNSGQRPNTGNDVTKDNRRGVSESPRPAPLARDGHAASSQAAATSGGNDANNASKRPGDPPKKGPEVARSGSTRLAAACRPSPTRSSLLRQAHNCPGSAVSQRRIPRPITRPTVDRTHRSSSEADRIDTQPHKSLRERLPRSVRLHSTQTSHDAAAQPRK